MAAPMKRLMNRRSRKQSEKNRIDRLMTSDQRPQLHVLDAHGNVLAAVERLRLPGGVQQVADWPDLTNRCAAHYGSIGVVAIDPRWSGSEIANCLTEVRRANALAPQSLFFAFGSPPVRAFARELLQAGFASVYCSTLDYGRLAQASQAWWNSLTWPRIEIETRLARDLPWADNG
jgi:hypothetical protein